MQFRPTLPPRLPSPPNRAILYPTSAYPRLTQHRHARPAPPQRTLIDMRRRSADVLGKRLNSDAPLTPIPQTAKHPVEARAMKTLQQLCTPRPSVFDPQRRDTVLDLADLTAGRIDPALFFEENYVTEGMKNLLEQSFRRLEGSSDQGIFKLKQAMGGGKTHNLLTLGLLARHPAFRQRVMGSFYTPNPELGDVRVVAFSGRESDVPFGVWGAIAEQMGKRDLFKELYSPLQAPGQKAWENLLAGESVLILLDELPPYFENARSKAIGNSDLAQVTATALSNLLVALGKESCSRVCLVITDVTAAYEGGSRQISSVLADFERETHRSAMSLEPVRMNSDELYQILRKRIFAELPPEQEVREVASAYAKAIRDAYGLAEEFCELLGQRVRGAGFLRTLLLRRVGSSIYAGRCTVERMLGEWETALESDEEDDPDEEESSREERESLSRSLTDAERALLERFVHALRASQERDPKYAVALDCLDRRGWLELGCIVFSQYRDSIQWLAEQLTAAFPDEPIAIYSGPATSGLMQGGGWTPHSREGLKRMVRRGELRLMLGTDAASEGLNLQKLARLINLDLPWNPTRLEQRKGRTQRIGQLHDTVQVYNLRYADSVEDRVHQLLSGRLEDIYHLFGQVPDVLEDVWVAVAQGEEERAARLIDALPRQHPFDVRYAYVEPVDWESCTDVLDAREKRRALKQGWG